MGNYNTQYQSYYNNLARKQWGTNKIYGDSNKNSRMSNFFIKRITRELIGVLVLIIFVLFCKTVVTPKTQYVYNYSKEAISKHYDYSTLINSAKGFKFEDIGSITVDFIDKVKGTISSEQEMIN
ncbi:endopeptidase [Clostridium sp.]|uniref:endopeptidase n=1 Tax=Clostridium sp. TaxID=1506 RepID=UPI001A4DC0CE|nr:endopeptidase [Clostridium sp.]MBK5241585.1 endopeptidase [Clostridium sp.]